MCKICEKGKELESDYLCLIVKGNKLNIYYDAYSCDSSFDEDIDINFCMNCGKDLRSTSKGNCNG